MSYTCLSIVLGIVLIFTGTIVGSIRNLLQKNSPYGCNRTSYRINKFRHKFIR